SMREYGNDKPDLRFGMQHVDLTAIVAESKGAGVPMWQSFASVTPGQIVKALKVPASANFSRTETDKLEEIAKGMGARGLARAKVGENGEWTQSPLAKSITSEARKPINAATGAEPGDVLLFQFGKESMVHTVLANLRLHLSARSRGASEGVRRHGDLARGGGAEVRLPPPGPALRRSAPRRHRPWDGPACVPAHRSGIAARRDPVPEDAEGNRSDDRCP